VSDLILVTGASGFVGAAVVRALLAEGRRVRVLVRPTSPRTNFQDLDVEVATGDLLDPASIDRAVAGSAAVMHVAADYRLWVRDPKELYRANVDGTRAVLEAALRHGVGRVVYTSSVATLKPQPGGRPADETCALTPETALGDYKRSKVVAERLVERMVVETGVPVVIVNPSTPIGPRDVKPTPTGRIIVEAARGGMPAYVDTGLNLVHVDDVAAGHLAALARGRIGERYILGGQDVPLAQMLADIAALTGRRPPAVRLPRVPLFPLAVVAEAFGALTGREPFLTWDALRMARYKMFFSSAKAEAELGYRARPYREALADALAWFRQAGMVAPGAVAPAGAR
jgi:dihydroflavonol-4-reductase